MCTYFDVLTKVHEKVVDYNFNCSVLLIIKVNTFYIFFIITNVW